jgi:hypothetical protein
MKTLTVHSEISKDGKLKIEVPCELPPGPVEVELTVRSQLEAEAGRRPRWATLYGLGKEVWQGIDPRDYVSELREDREDPRK